MPCLLYLTVKTSCLCKIHGNKSYTQLLTYQALSITKKIMIPIFTNFQVFKAVSEDVISKLLCQGHHLKTDVLMYINKSLIAYWRNQN